MNEDTYNNQFLREKEKIMKFVSSHLDVILILAKSCPVSTCFFYYHNFITYHTAKLKAIMCYSNIIPFFFTPFTLGEHRENNHLREGISLEAEVQQMKGMPC